jgi:hypothetical protein
MFACCGLNCSECPTYLATQNDNDAAREKVAGQWSKFFGMALKADEMNCDGCISGSQRMFMHCQSCQIRDCCQSKQLKTCAECDDYPCDKLEGFFVLMPAAQKGLEALRSKN